MKEQYSTQRLLLNKLNPNDAGFIFELVNMPEWIRFIGDRKVGNLADASGYIRKILETQGISYWVVRTRDGLIPIGIITLIKREYLAHPDIGFAFLQRYGGKGYAYEAASVVLNDLTAETDTQILATTIKENHNSIRLLEKLGLRFDHEMKWENEMLLVYALKRSNDKTILH